MTSDMPLPRLIEGRAARPALLSRTMNFRLMPRRISARIVYSLENRLGGGLDGPLGAARGGAYILWAGKNSAARRPYACRMKAPSS